MIIKKIFTIFILMIVGFFGCAHTHLQNYRVIKEISNIYSSSVEIVDSKNNVFGSGTIIYNGKGKHIAVITAAHVIKALKKKGKKAYVSTEYDAKIREMIIFKIDYKVDLALLVGVSLEKRNGPYVKFAKNIPKIGNHVWVIGAPLGERLTVTEGIISNVIFLKSGVLYRTNSDTFYGSSGGGMFNNSGELIGVVRSVRIITIGFSIVFVPGAYYAVGLETIKRFM